MQKYLKFANIITILNRRIYQNILDKISFYIRKILSLHLVIISVFAFSSVSHAQVFQQNEDVLAQGFDPISGSPDVHGNPNQFGILESPSEGDLFIGFHPGGALLPGQVPPDSSDVFESFSIPVNLVAGTNYRFSFDIAIGRLTGLTTNIFWNPKNLGDNPGFVRIFGGNGRGVRTQLLHTSITAQPGAPDWVNDSFDFTSLGNFTHLTFEAIGLGGGSNTPYILLDNLQSIPLVDLVTQKTLTSGNATPAVGDTVSYNINVTNNGPTNATNVSLTDIIPNGLTPTANNGNVTVGTYNPNNGIWTIGNLANGASASLTIEGIVQGSQGGNNITNITTAAIGDQIDPTDANDDLTESISVALIGPDTTIPAPVCGVNPNLIFTNLNFGSISPEIAQTIDAQATGQLESEFLLSNAAVINGIGVDVIATFDAPPTSRDGRSPRITGGGFGFFSGASRALSFAIVETGTNNPVAGNFRIRFGDVDSTEVVGISNVGLAGVLSNNPTNLTINDNGSTTTASGNGNGNANIVEDSVEFIVINQSVINTFIQNAGSNSGFTMRANLGIPIDNEACTSDIQTVKTLTSSNASPIAGETVTYEIAVTNNGPALINDINLTDLLPAGLTPTANNGNSSQGSYDANTGVWTVGTLANGGGATLTIEGVVDNGTGGDTITNQTTAATSVSVVDTVSNDDLDEAITVTPSADLMITKTNTSGLNNNIDQNDDGVVTGTTTNYVITVTNNGPDSISGGIVTDTIVSGLTCAATNAVAISGDGVPSGSFTVADLTGGGIILGTLADGESTTLSYDCVVN